MSSIFRELLKKELIVYFSSPIAYSVIIIFGAVAGIFAIIITSLYSESSFHLMQASGLLPPQELSVGNNIIRPFFNNLGVVLVMIIPVLTMRLFSEERKDGSIEYLLTWPIRPFDLVMSKFLAAFIVAVFMLGLVKPYFWFLWFYTSLPIAHIYTASIGLLLLLSSFISLGLFVSVHTKNQIVSAVISFGLLISLLMISLVFDVSSDATTALGTALRYILLFEHLDNFSKGVLDSRDVVYYLSFTGIFLFLAKVSLGSGSEVKGGSLGK